LCFPQGWDQRAEVGRCLAPPRSMSHAGIAGVAYLKYGAGPRHASQEHEKFIEAALDTFNSKMERLSHEQRTKLSGFKGKLDHLTSSQQSLETQFELAKDQCIAEIRELGRRCIEDTKEKVLVSARHFMETAAVTLRAHFERECERQRDEGLVLKIKDEAVAVFQEDLGTLGDRIRDQAQQFVVSHVQELYHTSWKDDMFAALRQDAVSEHVREEIRMGVESQFEEVRAHVRQQVDSLIRRVKETTNTKDEVRELISEIEDRQSHQYRTAVAQLEKTVTELDKAFKTEAEERSAALRDIHANGASIKGLVELERKHREDQMNLLTKQVREAVKQQTTEQQARASAVSGLKTQIDAVKASLSDETASREDRMTQLAYEVNRLTDFRADASNKLQTLIEHSEKNPQELREAIAQGIEVLTSRIDNEVNALTSTTKEIKNSMAKHESRSAARFEGAESARAKLHQDLVNLVGGEAEAREREEKNIRSTLKLIEQRIEEYKQKTARTMDEYSVTIKEAIVSVNDTTRVDAALEEARVRVEHSIASVSNAISAGEDERKAFETSVLAKINDVMSHRAALDADQKTQMDGLRRDMDFVVKPLFAGSDLSGGGTQPGQLLSTLAKSCLDWQSEHQQMREAVTKVTDANKAVESNVKQMINAHDRRAQDLFEREAARIRHVYEEFHQAEKIVHDWVFKRRDTQEVAIEQSFLEFVDPRQSGGPVGNFHDAMRDMLAQLRIDSGSLEERVTAQLMSLSDRLSDELHRQERSRKAMEDVARRVHFVESSLNSRLTTSVAGSGAVAARRVGSVTDLNHR